MTLRVIAVAVVAWMLLSALAPETLVYFVMGVLGFGAGLFVALRRR